MSEDTRKVIWQPQAGPQTALLQCPVTEIFFGGARGGGKTDGSIGDWLQHSAQYGPNAIGVFFRRTFKQLEEVIARTKRLFPLIGAKYSEQRQEWLMPGGGRLKFRYIERDSDAEQYQGHSYTRIYIEELTNFPTPGPMRLLLATLRSAEGVPCGMRNTGNPGGPGHGWVRARYIDPAPEGFKIIKERFEGLEGGDSIEVERVFIPSKLGDNKILLSSDIGYVARLRQVGKAALVEAWLKGDWSIIDGAFFDEWDEAKHVLPMSFVQRVPPRALRFRAMDWGSYRPFCVGWYTVSNGEWGLPVGALLKYREWYGASEPNVGLKLDAGLVAEGIVEREEGEVMAYGRADPSIFQRDGGPSIAEMMAVKKVSWYRADNKRQTGWEQLRQRLAGQDGRPMLYIAECCVDTIRTLPILQHDEHKVEDVDTDGEDHAGDETRYAVMSRPWIPDARPIDREGLLRYLVEKSGQMTGHEVIARHAQARREREEV